MHRTAKTSSAPSDLDQQLLPPPSAARRARLMRGIIAALVGAACCLSVGNTGATPAGVEPPHRMDDAQVPYPSNGAGDATVTVVVVVDATGTVTDVTLRDGEPPFSDAALAAARTWRFQPAMRQATPVPARILAQVLFHPPTPEPVSVPTPTQAPAAAPTQGASAAAAPLRAITVQGEREEPGNIHIPRTETRFVPGAFGDPFRIVEVLPGMAPWLSGLPYFYVRGAPPENVGYFVDGISVPLLFHVGAGPSTIAPALVDSVDLFPGAFPAMYGRYAGAAIAGKTTAPDEEAPHVNVGARLFDTHGFATAPWDNRRGTVMLAGRYSYTNLITSLFAPSYQVDYNDYQFRTSHRVNGKDTLALFVFGAHDELRYHGEPTFQVDYTRADLRYDHSLSRGNLRIASTFTRDSSLTALQSNRGVGESAALRNFGGRIRAELEQRVANRIKLRSGADFVVRRFTLDRSPDIHNTDVLDSVSPHTDLEGGVYADLVWRPQRSIELVPGFRFDGYRSRGQVVWAPQPRLSARMQLTPWLGSLTALGTAHQESTEEVFVPSKLPSNLSGNSYQFSQALEAPIGLATKLRLTAFHSRLLARGGVGQERATGGELFLHRDFSERLGAFISYTLSRSTTISPDQGSGLWRAQRSTWDRTHLLSTALSYDLGREWRVGTRLFVESGRPWRKGCLTADCSAGSGTSSMGRPMVYDVTRNLPLFFRVDARVEKRWTFPAGHWLEASLECFNASAQSEPNGADYTPQTGLVVRHQSAIILPSIGVEAGF